MGLSGWRANFLQTPEFGKVHGQGEASEQFTLLCLGGGFRPAQRLGPKAERIVSLDRLSVLEKLDCLFDLGMHWQPGTRGSSGVRTVRV